MYSRISPSVSNRGVRVHKLKTNYYTCKSYLDRIPDYDAHNRVFYIYTLGSWNNIPYYHYGESDDISLTEFKIKKTLPFYSLLTCIPIDHNIAAISDFEKMVRNKKVTIPVVEAFSWPAFTTDNPNALLYKVNRLFSVEMT